MQRSMLIANISGIINNHLEAINQARRWKKLLDAKGAVTEADLPSLGLDPSITLQEYNDAMAAIDQATDLANDPTWLGKVVKVMP